MNRQPGVSVRIKLTLSYAGFLVLAGAVLLVLWLGVEQLFPKLADRQRDQIWYRRGVRSGPLADSANLR